MTEKARKKRQGLKQEVGNRTVGEKKIDRYLNI